MFSSYHICGMDPSCLFLALVCLFYSILLLKEYPGGWELHVPWWCSPPPPHITKTHPLTLENPYPWPRVRVFEGRGKSRSFYPWKTPAIHYYNISQVPLPQIKEMAFLGSSKGSFKEAWKVNKHHKMKETRSPYSVAAELPLDEALPGVYE